MKILTTVTVLAALAAGAAFADCPAPEGSVQIPSGMAATRDEMVAAQKAVKAYDNAVREYSACMEQELQVKAAGSSGKAALADQYGRRTEAELDKVQKLADRFNNELRAFKARNGVS